MLIFVLRRLVLTLVVLAVVSVLAFSLTHLSGDPAVAIAGEGASAADVKAVRVAYGFDQPITVQYFHWLNDVFHGNFGQSYFLHKRVSSILSTHIPVTVTLGFTALAFALCLSIPLGVLAALRPNTWVDRLALTIAVSGQAIPSFVFGLVLIYVFGVALRWLPVSGSDGWRHYVLPSIALGYYATPVLMRLTRSGTLEALKSDHVRTARAFGIAPWRVVIRHALRHAIIPIIALTAVQLGYMLGGSIVIETVFSLNGMGYLAWQSIQRSDIEVIQAILLIIATSYALLTLIADILNATLDPRIRVH